jgi:hypothetical protein
VTYQVLFSPIPPREISEASRPLFDPTNASRAFFAEGQGRLKVHRFKIQIAGPG